MMDMLRGVRHRGPDGAGVHVEPGVGLAHARLSIIDLETGAQPMSNEDDTIWLTYNGEIFNYIELRARLVLRGHIFRTKSDTEVIIHLYEEMGDEFLHELNGQFALALWDRKSRRLLLARDRAGILPLHYTPIDGGWAFASEVKALLAGGWIRAELDPDGLDEVMTFWSPIAPRTAFRNVSQVCPGEVVVVDERGLRRRKYWSWDFPQSSALRKEIGDSLQQEYLALLMDATEIRLRADVPVGAYLSGGLDSSSLVALLQERAPGNLKTFSIGFEDAGLDESGHQAAVAAHLGTNHTHLRCDNSRVAELLPRVVRQAETPILRTAPAPMCMLSALVAAAKVKVVLTGEGADETLGGYDIFKEAKVRRFWARQGESSWRALLLGRLYPYLDIAAPRNRAYLRQFFGIDPALQANQFFSHLPRWTLTAQSKLFWSEDMRARVSGSAIERLRATLPASFGDWNVFNQAEYLEATTLLPGYLLSSQGDRMLMANSVEGRFPYLDHRLIEFTSGLHPRLKMRALREKWLLRQGMRTRLPATILQRHKQPYRAPDHAVLLSGGNAGYVDELLSADTIRRYGYFDGDRVDRLVRKLRQGGAGSQKDNMALVGILTTQLWHRNFVESAWQDSTV